jgi:hypothetical protein
LIDCFVCKLVTDVVTLKLYRYQEQGVECPKGGYVKGQKGYVCNNHNRSLASIKKQSLDRKAVVVEVNREGEPSGNTQSCDFEETQRIQHTHQKLDAVLI